MLRLFGITLTVAGSIFLHLTADDGLSQASVFSAVQDTEGNLWFGTYNGLNRYDGYEIKVYRFDADVPGSLCGNKVNALYVDPAGCLWAGTNKGVARYDARTDTFETVYGEDHLLVSGFIGTEAGGLLVGTRKGTLELRPGPGRKYTARPFSEMAQDAVFAVSDRGLFLGARDGKVRLLSTGNAGSSTTDLLSADAAVSSLFLQGADTLWAATLGDGLFRIDLVSGETTHFRRTGDGLCSDHIRTLCPDEEGNLWIGTDRNLSILHLADETFDTVRPNRFQPHALSNGSIKVILRDRAGGMWLGTYFGGVNYYHPQRIQFHTLELGNSEDNNIMGGISADPDGSLWIGTNRDGVIHYFPEEGRSVFLSRQNEDIKDIVLSTDGTQVLFGKDQDGCSLYDRSTRRYGRLPGKGIPRNVYSLLETPGGGWLLGSLSGLFYYREDTGRCLPVTDARWGASSPVVHVLLRDRKGQVWIGSEYTLVRCRIEEDGKGLALQDIREYEDIQEVEDIFEAADSTLWVGSRQGLFRYDAEEDRWSPPVLLSPLPSNIIRGIEEDRLGRLWLGTENGLCLYNPANGLLNTYTSRDGLPSNTFCTYAHTRDVRGRMYFGTLNGTIAFQPDAVKENSSPPPPPVIEGLFVGGRNLLQKGSGNIRLAHSQRNFSIRFSVPDYISWRASVFRYRLEGFDNTPHIADVSRTASWSNLPSGRYRFILEAANSDGVWCTEPVCLAIRVKPVWYRSVPAVILEVFLLLGLLYLGIRYLIRENDRKNRIATEKLVKAKQDEIDALKRLSAINQRDALVRRFAAGRDLPDEEYRFLLDTYAVVREHLGDEHFTVEDLAAARYMSRASLHRKVVAITGASALHFIRQVRFEEACRLLRTGTFTVAEVAYKVGFSSPAYFATSFKQFMGVSPSSFLDVQQN